MPKFNILILSLVLGIMTLFSGCKEKKSIPPDENEIAIGRILRFSCGGTVVQVIENDNIIGQDWSWAWDGDGRQTYENCITLIHETKTGLNVGDSIRFSYQSDYIDFGKQYCDIGGLPYTIFYASKLDNL